MFGWSCAMPQVARTAEKASGKIVRDFFASRIVSRLDSAYFLAGWFLPAGDAMSGALLKNVVTVQLPETVVPGRIGYFDLVGSARLENDRSPTLMIRDSLLSRAKKSSMLKYGPSTLIPKGNS